MDRNTMVHIVFASQCKRPLVTCFFRETETPSTIHKFADMTVIKNFYSLFMVHKLYNNKMT
jgi:hypothetical protein